MSPTIERTFLLRVSRHLYDAREELELLGEVIEAHGDTCDRVDEIRNALIARIEQLDAEIGDQPERAEAAE